LVKPMYPPLLAQTELLSITGEEMRVIPIILDGLRWSPIIGDQAHSAGYHPYGPKSAAHRVRQRDGEGRRGTGQPTERC
jgi:hypothetical protein